MDGRASLLLNTLEQLFMNPYSVVRLEDSDKKQRTISIHHSQPTRHCSVLQISYVESE